MGGTGNGKQVSRRTAIGAGLAVVVAGVAAVLLVSGPWARGSAHDPAASAQADQGGQREYPYPEVEEGKNYEWASGYGPGEDGFGTERTKVLDAALLGTQPLADADLAYWPRGYDDTVEPEAATAGAKLLGRRLQSLYPIEGRPGGPLTQLPSLPGSRPAYHGRLAVDTRPGDGFHDLLTVDVVPKGSYRKGAGDIGRIGSVQGGSAPWLTDGCADYDGHPQLGLDGPAVHTAYTCETVTTSTGLEAFRVTRDRVYEGGGVYEKSVTVVVYQENGNALVVTAALAPDARGAGLNGGRPCLDGDAVLAVAEALPEVVVE